MRANYKSRSISASDFLLEQLRAPRQGQVPEYAVSGNHAGVPLVSIGMIPRSMQGGCVTGSLPWRRPIIYGCLLLLSLSLAHALRAEDRITLAIDDSRRAALPGHVSPRTKSGVDQGPVDPSMDLPYVTLVLKPSASQQADLDRLLAQQQDPSSPNFHRWLTPEQYADRFGVSQADIDKMVAWLGQRRLTVKSIARGRNAIAFGGAAGQIGSAFGVEIHRYQVGGEPHYANATDPAIPVAFQGVVRAIHGLHDFRLKPMLRRNAQPRDTLSDGTHELAPDDVATIYDITPLYNAGYSGTGQKLVVAGQTQIVLSDIQQFRSFFKLPVNNPTTMLVPGTQDPGISQSDLGEADLDLELSGAVAREASILFVYSSNIMDAFQYAIDQNLAPVVSISYGDCELQTALSDAQTLETWGTQANAQGQTLFAASGDSGAADCFGGTDPSTNNLKSVDLPASLPQVTGVGGTEFNEGSGSYWNSNNTSSQASALRYIPETAWNESSVDGSPAASGGGGSVYFLKPSWQTGTGVPVDSHRDLPDVSLSASPNQDGYRIFTGNGQAGSGSLQIIGGTSVGPPQFAGIAVLLGQYLVANGFQSSPALGNINPALYALAPVTGVFHDITTGNNMVQPCAQQRGCTLSAIGYDTTVGYDMVTGLGTPDFYNLVTAWHGGSVIGKNSVTMKLAASPGSVTFSGTTVLTATVTSASGATPTGTVAFSTGTYSLGTATLNARALATLTLSGAQLAVGSNSITAQYDGDNSYYGASASATIAVTSPTNGPPSIGGLSNAASFTPAFAPGGILSVFGTQLAPATASAQAVPLPTMLAGTWATVNGVAAPLYYVSPTQLNIQIPYEVPANSTATLRVDNNGESVFYSFKVAATASGIFTFDGGAPVPFTAAAPGQVVTLYITGAGPVSPSVSTGAAPAAGTSLADLPAPVGTVVVTVGGVKAALDFVGIPTWSVGVVQINYTIPAQAPLGSQPVLVSVGGVQSASAQLTITQ